MRSGGQQDHRQAVCPARAGGYPEIEVDDNPGGPPWIAALEADGVGGVEIGGRRQAQIAVAAWPSLEDGGRGLRQPALVQLVASATAAEVLLGLRARLARKQHEQRQQRPPDRSSTRLLHGTAS